MKDTKNNDKNPSQFYVRIGIHYYKKVRVPLISGDYLEILIKWSYETIKRDHGTDIFKDIPKYDGFTTIPSHINYEPVINNFYNTYHKFPHKPKKGEWGNIYNFLLHIFQENLEMGLDYFQLLYQKPYEKLPIIALVSEEHSTGKTTFLNFLKAIFGGNMSINTNQDFRSQFNSDWANKLIIGIDETFLDRKEDSERIKNLAAANHYKEEAKGIDRKESEFFGKFVMTSNNIYDFIKIAPGDDRYWVIEVKTIKNKNPLLLNKIKDEIPHFIDFLTNRDLQTPEKIDRFWFPFKMYRTKALTRVIQSNKSKLEQELILVILWIIDNRQIDEIQFCLEDARMWLANRKLGSHTSSELRKLLQSRWRLKPSPNSLSYISYSISSSGDLTEKNRVGRYYTINREFISKIDNPMNKKLIN